jgi:FkbM family methyltransferase
MLSPFKKLVKRYIFSKAGIDFNPYGVPYALGKYLAHLSNLTLIDVGASRGDFIRSVDQMCGVAHGVLVELQPERARELRSEFREPRFDVLECALSNRPGQLEVEINHDDLTTSILPTKRDLPEVAAIDVRSKGTIVCESLTLDMVADRVGMRNLDLLKLDVQGAEHLVIEGGTNTLSRTKMIWTELSFVSLYDGSCLYSDIVSILQRMGFALFELTPVFRGPRGELLQSDALFMRM